MCIYIYTTLPCFMAILKNLHIKNLGFTMFHGHLWFPPPRRHRGARRARPRLPKSLGSIRCAGGLPDASRESPPAGTSDLTLEFGYLWLLYGYYMVNDG